jgi:hypothetical protein
MSTEGRQKLEVENEAVADGTDDATVPDHFLAPPKQRKEMMPLLLPCIVHLE